LVWKATTRFVKNCNENTFQHWSWEIWVKLFWFWFISIFV
jgi:hypothetical protein